MNYVRSQGYKFQIMYNNIDYTLVDVFNPQNVKNMYGGKMNI